MLLEFFNFINYNHEKKKKKITLIIITNLALTFLGLRQYVIINTKKHSPEATVSYVKDQAELKVFYNRPYKKGRKVFGGIVTFGRTWRTGANEATTFETSKDIFIANKILPKGKYTLWTVPNKKEWEVIFNSKMYMWGVKTGSGKASRDPSFDYLNLQIPVAKIDTSIEQFTILFKEINGSIKLLLTWDKIEIIIPIRID